MLFGGRVIGVCSLDSTQTHTFTQEQIQLAESLAAQAAFAIQNARLFEYTQHRAAELETLRRSSLQLASSLDLPAVLGSIVESALTLVEATNCHIYLYDEATQTLDFSTALWKDGRSETEWETPRRDGLTATVAREGRPVVINDAAHHPLYATAEAQEWGIQAAAGLPLKRAERVLGVLNIVFCEPHTISEEELRVLSLLADQAAMAIENARLYASAQDANEKMAQELALAGEVQTSFLPREVPDIPGWQLLVTLKPARETSGDFYDVNVLPNGRVGLLVADVVDKGVGAALYMALSWTLLRTYAAAYPTQPELVFSATNRRILMDTKAANQFVTVFYGILDPATGTLVYCNAGHCPPYLVGAQNGQDARELAGTGVPLGMFANESWGAEVVQLAPGDVLVVYSDGIPEARNEHGAFFEEDRMLASVRANLGRPAQVIQDTLIRDVCEFMNDTPPSDDITLAIVVRDMETL